MSLILVPKHGDDVQINGWNWGPTLELLRNAKLIDEENYERMGANGCGGKVDAETAQRIVSLIELKLAEMKPGDRLLADLTVTQQAKKKVTFTPDTEIDSNDLYSATYEWLVKFKDFASSSGGFEVR